MADNPKENEVRVQSLDTFEAERNIIRDISSGLNEIIKLRGRALTIHKQGISSELAAVKARELSLKMSVKESDFRQAALNAELKFTTAMQSKKR